MRFVRRTRRRHAFTGSDLTIVLVTLGVILVFAMLVLPRPRRKGPSARARCAVNLKQLALAFELWSVDNAARLGSNSYPMVVPESAGGSKQAIDDAWIVDAFRTISNELRIAKALACPADKTSEPAASFGALTARNISYFLAADGYETNVAQVLVGDRDIAVSGKQVVSGVLRLADPDAISWAGVIHAPNGGNVALTDGSMHEVNSKGLRDALRYSGSVTNKRLLIP